MLYIFYQNQLTNNILKKKKPQFIKIKKIIFKNYQINKKNSKIINTLKHLKNTFTSQTNNNYSLIHNSLYKILTYHYKNKNQKNILKYINNNFINKKFIINKKKNKTNNLFIKLKKKHYKIFTKQLLKNLTSLKLHNIFINITLKNNQIYYTFINKLKKLSYQKIKKLFFSKQKNTSKIISKNKHIKNKLKIQQTTNYKQNHQNILIKKIITTKNTSKLNIQIIN